MPLATKGVVKGIEPREVAALGYDMVLGNTFHLFLAPGHELVAEQGGLHEFMRWSGPIITDSGGFQVFSMGHGTVADEVKGRAPSGADRAGAILSIEEEGVRFRSYIDGGERFMAPETSMEVQAALGSDIALAFDECTPFHVDRDYTERSTERTHRWLERCLAWQDRARPRRPGVLRDLRRAACTRTCAAARRASWRRAARRASRSAARSAPTSRRCTRSSSGRRRSWSAVAPDKPRHLLGIGEIDDLVRGVELGIDTFDCAMPTRLGRHGMAIVPDPEQTLARRPHEGALEGRATSRSWRAARARRAPAATRAATCTTCSARAS